MICLILNTVTHVAHITTLGPIHILYVLSVSSPSLKSSVVGVHGLWRGKVTDCSVVYIQLIHHACTKAVDFVQILVFVVALQ